MPAVSVSASLSNGVRATFKRSRSPSSFVMSEISVSESMVRDRYVLLLREWHLAHKELSVCTYGTPFIYYDRMKR